MKKWLLYLVLVLGLSLLCSCNKQDTTVTSRTEIPITTVTDVTVISTTTITETTDIPDDTAAELTYTFIPSSNSGHMFDIYEVNQDGSKHKLLIEATNVGFNQPDWSPDGTVMAIWGWHSQWTISIYTYDTKTKALTRLTNQTYVYDMFPHWNASGDKIVFTRQYLLENDRNEIWSMNADGSNSKKIVDGYAASWSPDGQQLVYSQVTDGNEDLYTCNSDVKVNVDMMENGEIKCR